MKKLITSAISLLFCSVVGFAGTGNAQINWTGLQDTYSFPDVKKDTFRVSTAFACNSEKVTAVWIFADTANVNRSNDSVNLEIGYQMGYPVRSFEGNADTFWTNTIAVDTVNSKGAAPVKYNPLKYVGTPWTYSTDDKLGGFPVRGVGQIDTTIGTSSIGIVTAFTTFWSPLIRYYVKGGTLNAGTFIRAKVFHMQRLFNNVRTQ